LGVPAAPDYHFGTAPNAFLKSQAHRLKAGQKALALADGEGRNGVWLAQQGLDVLSLDFSPNALKKARALAAARGVDLRVELADLAQWRWPVAAFDLIAAIFIQFADPPFREKIFYGNKAGAEAGRDAADAGLPARTARLPDGWTIAGRESLYERLARSGLRRFRLRRDPRA